MKKLFLIVLCGLCFFGTTGCGNKEEQKEQESEKTPTKINLNDNLEVFENWHVTLCGGQHFTTNAEEVFKNGVTENTAFQYKTIGVGNEIDPGDWDKLKGQLTYDLEKEKAAEEKFNQITSNRFGVGKYVSSFKDHEFYTLEIVTSNKYDDVNQELKEAEKQINQELSSIFYKDAYLKQGPCGYGYSIPVTLTEEMCQAYNLNCGRW